MDRKILALLLVLMSGIALGAKIDPQYTVQRYSVLNGRRSFRYNNYTAVNLMVGVEVTKGRETEVMRVLPNTTDRADAFTKPFKAVFFPRVDQFALMRIASTRALLFKNVTMRAWLEIGGVRSEAKRMSVDDSVVGSRSAVVTLLRGNITSIDWDDDCAGCSAAQCFDGSCSIDASALVPPCDDPVALGNDAYRCGLKIYLAWIGTDSNGKPMKSISKLPSRFTKYSLVSNIYDAASGFWKDFLTAWSTPEE